MGERADRLSSVSQADLAALRRAGFLDDFTKTLSATSVLEIVKAIRLLEKHSGKPIQKLLSEENKTRERFD